MIRRPASCRRRNSAEAPLGEIKRIGKLVDSVNRVVLVSEIIGAFRQQLPLPTIRPSTKRLINSPSE